MTTTHVRVFRAIYCFAAMPAVLLMATVFVDPEFQIEIFTGYLYTGTAVLAVGAGAAWFVSGLIDAFSGK